MKMNERYLFKAKRIDNGEWVVGNVTQDESNYYIIPNRYASRGKIEVDPSTICYNTEVKDKKGNFIYENDIVSYGSAKYKIVWSKDALMWLMEDEDKFSVGLFEAEQEKLEIVGDSIDNPESLKKDEVIMTETEAINMLNVLFLEDTYEMATAKHKAVEALKKQIPMKSTEVNENCGYFECPACGDLIYAEGARFEEHKYCLSCGQKLDWSD